MRPRNTSNGALWSSVNAKRKLYDLKNGIVATLVKESGGDIKKQGRHHARLKVAWTNFCSSPQDQSKYASGQDSRDRRDAVVSAAESASAGILKAAGASKIADASKEVEGSTVARR